MPSIATNLNHFTESIIREMTRIANKYGAINLSQDFPDFDETDDTTFCQWLAKEIGVTAVPGSSFFREPIKHLIHFHFAKREETLVEAGERLLRLKSLNGRSE